MDNEIIELTKRHIGRCLGILEEAGAPKLYLKAIKTEFWLLSDDVRKLVQDYMETENEQKRLHE
jgi:hypothetical protein